MQVGLERALNGQNISAMQEEDRRAVNGAGRAKEPAEDKSMAAAALDALRDEYIPGSGEAEKAPGVYWLEADDNGNPKIAFDRADPSEKDAQAAAEALPERGDEQPEKTDASDENGEEADEEEKDGDDDDKKETGMRCTVDTNAVEAEIKQLKAKEQQLRQQMSRAADEDERRRLEAQLSQATAELASKDNDAYRKAKAVYTFS